MIAHSLRHVLWYQVLILCVPFISDLLYALISFHCCADWFLILVRMVNADTLLTLNNTMLLRLQNLALQC